MLGCSRMLGAQDCAGTLIMSYFDAAPFFLPVRPGGGCTEAVGAEASSIISMLVLLMSLRLISSL